MLPFPSLGFPIAMKIGGPTAVLLCQDECQGGGSRAMITKIDVVFVGCNVRRVG